MALACDIQREEGLIGQDDLGVLREGLSLAYELLLAAGEAAHVGVDKRGSPNEGEQLFGLCLLYTSPSPRDD